MSDKARQTRAGRKLGRAEVIEVLERNARLYKDDPTFISYIVEMALYLLEYEYDWGNSGATPPAVIQAAQAAAQAAARPGSPGASEASGGGSAQSHPRQYQPIPPARAARAQTRGGGGTKDTASKLPPPAIQRAARTPRPRHEEPIASPAAKAQPASSNIDVGSKIQQIPTLEHRPAQPPPVPKTTAKTGEVRDLLRSISGLSGGQPARSCPHCGARIGDEHICPQCRNITR